MCLRKTGRGSWGTESEFLIASWQGLQTDRPPHRECRYYPSYLVFFTREVVAHGAGEALERYIFAPVANGNGAHMLLRFIGGA